jgi:hypothetical protein
VPKRDKNDKPLDIGKCSRPALTIMNKGGNRIFVLLDNTIKVDAMLDTGVESSVISEELYNHYVKEIKPLPLEKSTTSITCANGTPIEILGKTHIDINAGNYKLNQEVYVIRHVTAPLILGLDFMSRSGTKIDIGNHTVTFNNGETFPLGAYAHFQVNLHLVNKCNVEIPSYTEAIIKVMQRGGNKLAAGETVLIQPSSKLQDRYNLLGSKSICTTQTDHVYFKLANCTASPVYIRRGAYLGSMTQLHLDDPIQDPRLCYYETENMY